MDWVIFTKVTAELGAVGFDGFFAFHNYNEPLANPRLRAEITHVRAGIPAAKPAIYTNGDLLTRDVVAWISEVGVKYLRVTRYPHRADVQPTFAALDQWLVRARLRDCFTWRFDAVRQGLAAIWTDPNTGMTIEVIRPSIATYNDRGGTATVQQTWSPRTVPCKMTATSLSVDWRGDMKMCCNVVPEGVQHREYVVGNVAEHSLAALWDHSKMVEWRERHARADWTRSPACVSCAQALPETRR
ncbi:MAG TPA: SPASM domain-containing protein [Pseudonocardiaceae bacterium]|nr:SPASM domain-containing protein [Pseudonocardiaceae bacterium]